MTEAPQKPTNDSVRLHHTARIRFGRALGFAILLFVLLALGPEVLKDLALRLVPKLRKAPVAYLMEREEYDYSKNPQGDLIDRTISARRSDGARVYIGPVLGPTGLKAGEIFRHIDYPDGNSITLMDSLSAKTTWPRGTPPFGHGGFERAQYPPADCVLSGEKVVGHETLSGADTVIVKVTRGRDAFETQWRSPRLDCTLLQYRIETTQPDGSSKLSRERRLIRLEFGEPDSGLFDPGKNYTEMKPSEMYSRSAARLGIAWTEAMQRSAEEEDALYRPPKPK